MFAFNLLFILYHGKSTGMKNQTRHSITAENAESAEVMFLCFLYSVILNINFAN